MSAPQTHVPMPANVKRAARRKRNRTLATYASEIGLVLLALALALMSFTLVHRDITKPQTIPHARLDIATSNPNLKVVLRGGQRAVELKLLCSEVDRVEAESILKDPAADPLRLVIDPTPPASHRLLDHRDRLDPPFRRSLLTGDHAGSMGLDGWVVLSEERDVPLRPPVLDHDPLELEEHGLSCTLRWVLVSEKPDGTKLRKPVDTVRLRMPVGERVEDQAIFADAVRLGPLLKKPHEDGAEELLDVLPNFDAWQGVGPSESYPWQYYRQQHVTLPKLRILARFSTLAADWASKPIENRLVFLVQDPHEYSFEFDHEETGIDKIERRVAGILRSSRSLRERLVEAAEANLGARGTLAGWVWGLELSGQKLPSLPEEGVVVLTGRIRFVSLSRSIPESEVTFEARDGQSEFEVRVKKKP